MEDSDYVQFVEVRARGRLCPQRPSGPCRCGPTPSRRLPANFLSSGGSGALSDACSAAPFTHQVTTRNEVDEDAWDSDGAHTHTSVVTGSTVRVCLPAATGWATGWGAPAGLGC